MFGACLLFLLCGVNRLHASFFWMPVDLMHGCHYWYTQFYTVQLGCTLFFLPRRKSELSLFRLHWRYIKVIMFARMHICATPIPNSSKQWTSSVFVFFLLLSTLLLKGVKALCVCVCVCIQSYGICKNWRFTSTCDQWVVVVLWRTTSVCGNLRSEI